ncbi:bifunctional riboflavin kinase/FAD synthetase [Alkaliphilus peptidifermentans]|uniref:Riboflavin biosynthesis protein n=1 Tax=Alkaliphilus peptidifermentans DSM 18978 TaxID=1120976 RepID=A0A1G5CTH4_9FIRM|nr:bifunctional riboflavin kinase/FAD synthetase [Alkaliphilus peptidifermentans]SCY05702.1 riboflavin kinase / FMN adenylyltransferase [Alkaliphilus peptidifermentans DSM 18978]
MNYIQGKDFKMKNTCIAFGNFDGLHRGHQAVIQKLIKQENKELTSILLNLEYMPDDLNNSLKEIYTTEEKLEILNQNSPKIMISYPFCKETKLMEPEEFVKKILVDKLDAKVIVVGKNCKFGRSQAGNIETLKALSSKYGYQLVPCEEVKLKGETITTKWLRSEIVNGELEIANELLGHSFSFWGKIVHGKALGRTVGMPTANLGVHENKLIPRHGVYATLSEIDGELFQGLTNIGLRPSVDNHGYVTIETFLLDFSRQIYDKEIKLELHNYIRDVKKFDNLDEVKYQVEKDILQIKECLNEKDKLMMA